MWWLYCLRPKTITNNNDAPMPALRRVTCCSGNQRCQWRKRDFITDVCRSTIPRRLSQQPRRSPRLPQRLDAGQQWLPRLNHYWSLLLNGSTAFSCKLRLQHEIVVAPIAALPLVNRLVPSSFGRCSDARPEALLRADAIAASKPMTVRFSWTATMPLACAIARSP